MCEDKNLVVDSISPTKLFGELLSKLNRSLKRDINAILVRHKISYLEWTIISRASRNTNIAEIADDLGLIESVVSRYVISLEKRGILSSDFDYADDKFKLIYINAEFCTEFEKINKEINKFFKGFLNVICLADMTKFGEILLKLEGGYGYINYLNGILGIHQSGVPK